MESLHIQASLKSSAKNNIQVNRFKEKSLIFNNNILFFFSSCILLVVMEIRAADFIILEKLNKTF